MASVQHNDQTTHLWSSRITLRKVKRFVLQNKFSVVAAAIAGVVMLRKLLDVAYRQWNNYPPGPCGVPYFGSFFSMHLFGDIRKFHYYLGNAYGSVCMIYLGKKHLIIINDIKTMHKYFLKNNFRPMSTNVQSFFFENDPKYTHRKKYVQSSIISFESINNKQLTFDILFYLKNVVFVTIDKCMNDCNSWDPRKDSIYITFAIIFGMFWYCMQLIYTLYRVSLNCFLNVNVFLHLDLERVFGERIDLNSQEYKSFIQENIKLWQKIDIFRDLHGLFSNNKLLFGLSAKYIGFWDIVIKHRGMIEKWVSVYKTNSKTSTKTRKNSYLSVLIKGVDNKEISKEEMIADITTVLQVTTHTTGLAINQCMLYLAKLGIETQNIFYNELLTNSNSNMNNILSSIDKCDQFKAFIFEILRLQGANTVTLSRYYGNTNINTNSNKNIEVSKVEYSKEKKSNEILSYNIPFNSSIHGNIWFANHNKQDFEQNHWDFDYKRWLNNKNEFNNKFDTATFGFGKFSFPLLSYLFNLFDLFCLFVTSRNEWDQLIFCNKIGKRSCLGKMMALKEIYLMVGALIMRYKLKIDEKNKDSFDIPTDFLFDPKLKVIPIKRQSDIKMFLSTNI